MSGAPSTGSRRSRSSGSPHGGIGEEIERETRTGAAIEDEGTRLAAHLRHTHPQERTLMAVLALALGTAGTLACGFTLFHYNRRHLEIHWRTA